MANWRLFLAGWVLVLAGLVLAHIVQTAGGVSLEKVRFSGADGHTISAHLYKPKSATTTAKAPAILAVHGYINSKEVQSGFAIEFARRGYVVLAIDQLGHGYSDAPAFVSGFGGPASLAYLRGLPFVDTENIGLEGHSMGGWTVLAAAAAMPDGYKSIVLVGSSTGPPFALDGTPDWPRNTAVVFSDFDEFAPLMWGVTKGSEVNKSEKLQALFGIDGPIVEGQIYGSMSAGSARILLQPPVTHPGDHISTRAIGHAVDWFDQTLAGATSIPSGRQVWVWKEVGTGVALIGFVLLVLGAFEGLLSLRVFAGLRAFPEPIVHDPRTPSWWANALASMVFPVASFYPVFRLTELLLPASAWLPQSITTQVAVWALFNAFLVWVLGFVFNGRAAFVRRNIPVAITISVLALGAGYLAVFMASAVFNLDFRIWFVGVKLLSLAQAKIALIYLLPFALYFTVTLRALHKGLTVATDSPLGQYLSNAAVLAGGFILFLAAQYGALFRTGTLITPTEPLNTIIMMQFVPLMLIISVFATFTYRRTGSYVSGVTINTLFVTWYIVAGQATQFAASGG